MSLVGPRPEMPGLHAELDPHFASARTFARPGCTGLWQVGRHCDRLIGESPQYDSFYIANYGLALDLWIMLQTARKVVQGGRTVELHEVPAWAERARPVSLPVEYSFMADVIELRPSHQAERQLQTAEA
jgi:hypothetical protein